MSRVEKIIYNCFVNCKIFFMYRVYLILYDSGPNLLAASWTGAAHCDARQHMCEPDVCLKFSCTSQACLPFVQIMRGTCCIAHSSCADSVFAFCSLSLVRRCSVSFASCNLWLKYSVLHELFQSNFAIDKMYSTTTCCILESV